MKRLLFYYDIQCPYAYLASTQIEAVAARAGVELEWKPMLLGGVFKAIGREDAPMPAAKARLNVMDQYRQAAQLGVPIAMPMEHPRRTVQAMRLCHCVDGAARTAITHALYRAYWVDGRDVADATVLGEIARAHGVDPARIDEGKQPLFATTDEAVKEGVFGAPAMVVVDGAERTLYWGNDRLHLVERQLSRGSVVDFFYDFSSPYSYLGSTQIERVARERGARVRWRPFLLGALFKAIGTPVVPIQAASEPKRRYLSRDALDWAEYWGVPLRWPSRFPMRTVLPLRLVLAVGEAERPALSHAIYRAFWADDLDISDPSVLARFCDAGALDRAQNDPAVKQALVDATDQAIAAGLCGAPSFLVGDQLFWGQDRMAMVSQSLAASTKSAGNASIR
jgi:2-hydroxychromene-2-carboxylate isomerase